MAVPIRKTCFTGEKFPLKGLYLWESTRIASDPDVVISRAAANHITEIYVPYNTANATDAQYRYFIRECWRYGITVQALFGDPMWALPDYRDRGTTAIQKVADYNAKVAAPIERFVGVQFDVEPHGLNGNNGYPDKWNTDRVGTIKTWLDGARIWAGQAGRLGLRFGAAILAFLDNTTNYPVPPEYAAAGSRVSDIVTDIHDYVVVMGYRDTPQAVYDLDIDEVSYAKTPKVIVAFESTAQTPANVTFMEEGFFAMEASMAAVHGMFKSLPGYKGVAVHAFRQWEPFIAAVGPKAPVRALNKVR